MSSNVTESGEESEVSVTDQSRSGWTSLSLKKSKAARCSFYRGHACNSRQRQQRAAALGMLLDSYAVSANKRQRLRPSAAFDTPGGASAARRAMLRRQ
jgi:hypothetical protein